MNEDSIIDFIDRWLRVLEVALTASLVALVSLLLRHEMSGDRRLEYVMVIGDFYILACVALIVTTFVTKLQGNLRNWISLAFSALFLIFWIAAAAALTARKPGGCTPGIEGPDGIRELSCKEFVASMGLCWALVATTLIHCANSLKLVWRKPEDMLGHGQALVSHGAGGPSLHHVVHISSTI